MNQPERPASLTPFAESTYVDALKGLEVNDVLRKIIKIEAKANLGDDQEPSDKALDKLDRLLLVDGTEQAVFSGLVYETHSDGSLAQKKPRMFVDADVTFEGADYVAVDEAVRIVFAMKRLFLDRKTNKQVAVRFATSFGTMLRLDYLKEPLLEVLVRHSNDSRGMVASQDFLQATHADQEELLETIAGPCYEELAWRLDKNNVVVACTRYFVCADVTGGEQPEFIVHDAPQELVVGSLDDCLYPDILERNEQPFRTPEDFSYGTVPYIVLRDDKAGTATFIAIDTIRTIE